MNGWTIVMVASLSCLGVSALLFLLLGTACLASARLERVAEAQRQGLRTEEQRVYERRSLLDTSLLHTPAGEQDAVGVAGVTGGFLRRKDRGRTHWNGDSVRPAWGMRARPSAQGPIGERPDASFCEHCGQSLPGL
jgi:hypothetical protein